MDLNKFISSLNESVFVIDAAGKIVNCNVKFKHQYKFVDVNDLYIQSIILDPAKIDEERKECCREGVDFCTCFTQEVSIIDGNSNITPSVLVMIKTCMNNENLFICIAHKKEEYNNIEQLDRINLRSKTLLKRLHVMR